MSGEMLLEEKEGIHQFIHLSAYLPTSKFCFIKGNRAQCIVQVKDKRVMPTSPVSLSVSWAMVLAEPHLDTVASAGHTWQE